MADGNGKITGGADQFVQGASLSTNAVTGSYSIASDGTGLAMLSIGNAQFQLALTVTSATTFSWIEFDSFATGAGGAKSQNVATLTSIPSGTFILHFHSFEPNAGSRESVSTVGSMTISNGGITGREDIMRTGVFSSPTLTGSINTPDSTGTGTLSLTDSSGVTSTYLYYILDSNTVNLMETDFDASTGQPHFGTGRIEIQSGTPFNNASLSNQFAFSSTGEGVSTPFSVVTAGAFTADGNGTIVTGSYDSVVNGSPIINAALTGTYTVSPAGRLTLSFVTQLANLPAIPEVGWIVNSSRVVFLVDLSDRAEDGVMVQQQTPPFSEGSLNGQFGFTMFGGDNQSPSQVARVGLATADGQSTMTLVNYFVNRGGSRNQTKSSAFNYTVSANGRVSATIPGLTNSFVMYLTSNNSAYLMLEDPQTEISGTMTQQALQ